MIILTLAIYSYSQFHISEYWLAHSKLFFLLAFGLSNVFLCVNLIEHLQQIRIVLSPVDFHISIYANDRLKQRCSIDRAYVCLHQIESYNVLLYHLVFVVEDIDLIKISDYFSYQWQLRQIGQRLAENLLISYVESQHWIGIFPKYQKLRTFTANRDDRTVNSNERTDSLSRRTSSAFSAV